MKSQESIQKYRKTKKGLLTNIFQRMKYRSNKYGYKLGVTLKELHAMYLKDKKFIMLYNKWVKNGFKYYDIPSIDRKNPYLGYTKDNMQILSWKQNRRKGDKEVSIKKYKPIWCCDMDGNKIQRYPSIKDAVKKLKLNQGLISAVLSGTRRHTGGYKFIYDNSVNRFENPELLNQ